MDDADGEEVVVPFNVQRDTGEKVAHQVARAIVRDIVGQGLSEGVPLPPEPVMLATYRVGRPTLREALRILEVNGLITIKAGRSGGPRVRRSDTRDLARLLSLHFASRRVTYAEITSARREIEPTLARLAAQNSTETERQQLAELLHSQVDPAAQSCSSDSLAFHRTIAVISHDAVLGPLGAALQFILEPLRVEPTRQWSVLMAEHVPIGEAIIRGDHRQAEELMAEHMKHYPPPSDVGSQIVGWA